MAASESIWAIVPAAGIGARMRAGIPKQYLPLLGRPVIVHTLERLCSYAPLRGVLVGISPQDTHWPSLNFPKTATFLGTYAGGDRRAQTVLNGLNALPAQAKEGDWVMVHDAVRPCVNHGDLDKLVVAAKSHDVGALLAVPVTDTLKRTDATGQIEQTVPRSNLWRALTPQMFRLGPLHDALMKALSQGQDPTDEAAAMESIGARPYVVEGRSDNIKITLPGELALAELYLQQQREQNI